jgi:hypothetical protein
LSGARLVLQVGVACTRRMFVDALAAQLDAARITGGFPFHDISFRCCAIHAKDVPGNLRGTFPIARESYRFHRHDEKENDMEVKQIKQELSQVEQIIGRALQALKTDDAAPRELTESVKELDGHARKAKQSQDERILVQCVEDMEAASDRARDAVERTIKIDAQTRSAVLEAHNKLSSLKHQLH